MSKPDKSGPEDKSGELFCAFFIPSTISARKAQYYGMDSALEVLRATQAAGFLNNSGINAFTLEVESTDQVAQAFVEKPIKLAIILPTYATLMAGVDIANALKTLKISPHITFAGELSTFAAKNLIEDFDCIDSVMVGEMETASMQLFKAVEGADLVRNDVAGLIWKDYESNKIVANPPALPIDLDALPLTDTSALPAPVVLTSRGCTGACSFCSESRFYAVNAPDAENRGWRAMSPEKATSEVIATANAFRDTPGKDLVHVVDANFIGPGDVGKDRAARFAEIMINEGAQTCFELRMRADSLGLKDQELIELLRRAGLISVFLGIEAFSRPSLSLYDKGVTWGDNLAAIDMFEQNDITTTSSSFILFHPWITLGELKREAGIMLRAGKSNLWTLSRRLALLPGAPIADRVKGEGLLITDKLYKNPFGYKFIHPEVEKLLRFMDSLEQETLEEDTLIRGIRMLKAKADRSLWMADKKTSESEGNLFKEAEWKVFTADHDLFVSALEKIRDRADHELESLKSIFLSERKEHLSGLKQAFKSYIEAVNNG